MADAQRNRTVFINCPFDPSYRELFRAVVLTLTLCGYVPVTALDETDSGETRIDKLYRLIGAADHTIHDLSAQAMSGRDQDWRLNMPVELGIALGARRFGANAQRRKRILILDKKRHHYDRHTSDLSGNDIRAHNGTVIGVIKAVRDWIAEDGHAARLAIPGADALKKEYAAFKRFAVRLLDDARQAPWDRLEHPEYLGCVAAYVEQRACSADVTRPTA